MIRFSCCSRACCAALFLLPLYLPVSSSAATDLARHLVILHKFEGMDGTVNPIGPLVQDASGNLFGETEIGGSDNAGIAYELSPHGSRWKETVLHNFSMADGVNPLGGLTLDDQGNLYGTEFSGPAYGGGVFELSPGEAGAWNFTQLYTFRWPLAARIEPLWRQTLRDRQRANSTGPITTAVRVPVARFSRCLLPKARDGLCRCCIVSATSPTAHIRQPGLFAIASEPRFTERRPEGGDGHCRDGEGDDNRRGCGTAFLPGARRVTPSPKRTCMIFFQGDEENGPYAPLTFGPGGLLYGSAGYDVFALVPQDGGGWQKQIVYEFKEGIAGTITSSGVTLDAAGNLYGTTTSSGLNGFSTVYELSPPHTGKQHLDASYACQTQPKGA